MSQWRIKCFTPGHVKTFLEQLDSKKRCLLNSQIKITIANEQIKRNIQGELTKEFSLNQMV